MSVDAVIKVAEGELGHTEWPPNSNITPYGEEYGMNGVPYCAQGLWWTFLHAGESSAFLGGGKTASCGVIYRWYKEMGQTVTKDEAQRGDIVILNFSGTSDTEHCGLITQSVKSGGKLKFINTIEFNTSPGSEGSQDNGGCVAAKVRYPRNIVGVCRPKYKEEVPVPKNDYEHIAWANEAIEWCIQNGIMTGYTDGSFKPNNTITRAEVAVVLRRQYNLLSTELNEQVVVLNKKIAVLDEHQVELNKNAVLLEEKFADLSKRFSTLVEQNKVLMQKVSEMEKRIKEMEDDMK